MLQAPVMFVTELFTLLAKANTVFDLPLSYVKYRVGMKPSNR